MGEGIGVPLFFVFHVTMKVAIEVARPFGGAT